MAQVSDCCGAVASGCMTDVGLCPDCQEHCDFIDDEEDEETAEKEV